MLDDLRDPLDPSASLLLKSDELSRKFSKSGKVSPFFKMERA